MQKFLAYNQLSRADRVSQLHGCLAGTMQAMEAAGRTVCDFTHEAPWECIMDMARQVWDKARHIDIFLRLLAHHEGVIGGAVSVHVLDFVAADELTHMRMRSKWLRELPADAPERLRKAFECQQSMAE